MTLKPQDAAALIGQTTSEGTVLIGGQAVAFWADHFGLRTVLAALTVDIDYLGTRREAQRADARLRYPHRLTLAAPEDLPNTALLSVAMKGYKEPVVVDYLSGILGVESRDIIRSAITVDFHGQPLKIIHPVPLLQSKFWNLYRLPAKRSPAGIEQARLAIEIVAAFLRTAEPPRRELLKAIERIGRFAATNPARDARERYGLQCLKAIPEEVFRKGALPVVFHEKRWPQIVAAAE